MSRQPMMPKYYKDPSARKDYPVDFTDWLDPIPDTIASVLWTVPSGITNYSESFTTKIATIWLTGGTLGTTYAINCRITTTGGRIEEQSFVVEIKQH